MSSTSETAGAGGAVLRVASYNIHGAVGTDRRRDVERIAAVIAEIDADVVALQEVESRRARGGRDQARLIAAALGMEVVEGPILEDGFGWYGNAILSRRPARAVERWRYSRFSREPRAAVAASLTDPKDACWRIVATHLDLRWYARQHQVRMLVKKLRSAGQEPVVVLADLNEWWPWAPSWQELRSLGSVPEGVPTFPSRFPLFPLDRAVLRHCHATGPLRAHVTPLSRRASDHLPIVLEVRAHGPQSLMAGSAAQ